MNYSEVIKKLKSLKNPRNAEGMARFGIRPKTKVFGIPIPELRKLAKIIKKDHKLALKLFDSGIHEARILAGFIADAGLLTEKQMDKWINGFDSWDVVDQVCLSLFDKASFIYKKVFELAKTRQKPKRHLDRHNACFAGFGRGISTTYRLHAHSVFSCAWPACAGR